MSAVGLRGPAHVGAPAPRADIPIALVWPVPPALTGTLWLMLGNGSLIAGAVGLLPFVGTGGYAVGHLPVWLSSSPSAAS